jgi:hypothetical protein
MGTAEMTRSHGGAQKREIKGRSRDQKAENFDKVDFLWNDWMLDCPMGVVGRIYSAYGRCVGSADYWETKSCSRCAKVLSAQSTSDCCYLDSIFSYR